MHTAAVKSEDLARRSDSVARSLKIPCRYRFRCSRKYARHLSAATDETTPLEIMSEVGKAIFVVVRVPTEAAGKIPKLVARFNVVSLASPRGILSGQVE